MAWWTTWRPAGKEGRVSAAITHRSSSSPVGTRGRHQVSPPSADTSKGFDLMT